MDIPFAEWLLSAAAFVFGTLTPGIVQRLGHQGISIKPLAIQVVVPGNDPSRFLFGALIKAANASRNSILVDDIRVKEIEHEGHRFQLEAAVLADVTEHSHVYIPIGSGPAERIEVLPLILKVDSTRVFALQLEFFYPGEDVETALGSFGRVIQSPFVVEFRINGKFRSYAMDFQRLQPVVGYEFHIGDMEHGK